MDLVGARPHGGPEGAAGVEEVGPRAGLGDGEDAGLAGRVAPHRHHHRVGEARRVLARGGLAEREHREQVAAAARAAPVAEAARQVGAGEAGQGAPAEDAVAAGRDSVAAA